MKQRNRRPGRPELSWAIVAFLAACPGAASAQFLWSGLSTEDGGWNRSANWVGGTPIGSPLASVTFAGVARVGSVQNIADPFILNTLSFAAGTGSFGLSGNALLFIGNASLNQDSANRAMRISNRILIDDTLNVGGAGNLLLSGALSGTNPATLSKTGSGRLLLDGAGNSLNRLRSAGTGTIEVSGSLGVTSTGGSLADAAVVVSDGTLRVLLGGTLDVSAAGATLLDGVGAPNLTIDGAGSRMHAGSTLKVSSLASVNVLSGGSLTAGTTSMANSGGRIDVTGGSFVTGLLASGGAVGAVSLLDPAGGTALTINGASGAANFGGTLSGSGSLVKTGASLQGLSGDNSAFTGATRIDGGQLVAAHALALAGSVVTINVNNGLDVSKVGTVTLGGLAGSGALSLGSTELTLDAKSFAGDLYSGVFSASTAGLVKTGVGKTVLTGTGSQLDHLTVSAGTLELRGGWLTVPSTGNPIALTNGSMSVTAGARLSAGGTSSIDTTNGAFFLVDGTGSQFDPGVQMVVGKNNQGTLTVQNRGLLRGSFVIVGVNPGSAGLLNVATGGQVQPVALILGGLLSGAEGSATLRDAGSRIDAIVSIGVGGYSAGQTGGTGTLTISEGGAASAPATNLWTPTSRIVIDRGTLTTSRLFSQGAVGSIGLTDPAGGPALILNSINTALYSGDITGSGSVLKSGTGTQTLAGGNRFTGSATVTGGVLDMATGAASFYAASGGTLRLGAAALGSAVVQSDPGSSVIYTASALSGGTLIGGGTHDISTVTRLSGTQVSNGTTLAPGTHVDFIGVANAGQVNVAAGSTVSWNGGNNSGSIGLGGVLHVSNWSSTGQIVIGSGAMLSNSGSTLLLGGGSQTLIGSVAAPGGTLQLASGSRIDLNGGLLVNNGTINGPLNVNFGSLAKGAGSFGAVTVGDGGRFSPGNSPGAASSTAANWNAGGSYLIELASATGNAGTAWDLWNVEGALNIAAGSTPNSRFTLALQTLDASNGAGPLGGFDSRTAYQWQVVRTGGGIVGFDAARVVLDARGFLGGLDGGSFSVATSGNDLYVNYLPSAVPEPAVWLMWAAGGALLWVRRQRRSAQRTQQGKR